MKKTLIHLNFKCYNRGYIYTSFNSLNVFTVPKIRLQDIYFSCFRHVVLDTKKSKFKTEWWYLFFSEQLENPNFIVIMIV